MITPIVTLLLFLSVVSAQFQFFEQFFQGGQQQAAPEKQNVPSDSNWYRQNWEGGTSIAIYSFESSCLFMTTC